MEGDNYPAKKPGGSLFPWLVIVALALAWLYYTRDAQPPLDPTAKPRAVTPRGSLADDERNSIRVFETISPAVVYITSVEMRRNLFSLNIHAIPKGTGSGFIWDKDGRIVTNFHVIEDANRIEVTLADGSNWKASLIGTAPDKDIAVLQISAPPGRLKPIPVGNSVNLRVGQKVYAIGNPFGLDQTMTSGIVSAIGREIKAVTGRTIHGMIQTDAAINPGNSGGPLLDSSGRLIGVNTAIFSPSGASAGIGFAVPVEAVNSVVPEVIRFGKVIRPGLGVSIAHDSLARRLGVEGVLIVEVKPGSAAESAGLRGTRRENGGIVFGDIIVGVNGAPVPDFNALRDELDRYKVGDSVDLEIIRDQQRMRITARLEEVA